MAIIKDVTVKINNGTATLDAPIQFYEKDHDVELRFKLMDYKYKYDKDPQNILNSVDEDVLEAYTTIVNPIGYELEQINGVVENDTVIFRLDPTYTDELEELGTYKLQIHIKCTHSEFTIPPITFEVLQRLKGIKVVTDGEDEVDNSEILDNSSKFVSDETGKLIIEWKKGDMISSAKLNAMVDVINDAVDEEVVRQANEKERQTNEIERQQKVDASISDYETRFNALTVSQQQDAEVIDARDGEQTLRARLDRDIQKPLIIYEEVEGSYISCDSAEGYVQNVEILGNTIQNQNDLADIRSVGEDVEGQELYEIDITSCGKNLIRCIDHSISGGDRLYFEVNLNKNTDYIVSASLDDVFVHRVMLCDGKQLDSMNKPLEIKQINTDGKRTFNTESNYGKLYILFHFANAYQLYQNISINFQLEEGTVKTPYEPYQEDKLTILSPVQLEKVGDVADRIICKDGVWGVEKNIETMVFDGDEDWVRNNVLSTSDIICMHTREKQIKPSGSGLDIISDKFIAADYETASGECISKFINGAEIVIKVTASKLSIQDVVGFKIWLQSNPVTVIYQTMDPQFIPLPHDQQIKLRTFAGKTNISFLTEIEGTIKAQIPQSIGATISAHTEQIDNLGKELDRVKKLEESATSTVTTESNITTVENTSNGYFEDVKLEGKTLVNLMDSPIQTKSSIYGMDSQATIRNNSFEYTVVDGDAIVYFIFKLSKSIEFNKQYTIFYTINENSINSKESTYGFYTDSVYGSFYSQTISSGKLNGKLGTYVALLDSPRTPIESSSSNMSNLSLAIHKSELGGKLKVSNIMLLEGDHTQNPPGYFEGLKSVGDGVDDVSVESADIYRIDNMIVGSGSGTIGNGLKYPDMIKSYNKHCISAEPIKVFPNTKYNFSSGGEFRIAIIELDRNNIQIQDTGWTIPVTGGSYITSLNCTSILVVVKKDIETVMNPNEINGRVKISHKFNKKPLLYYNPTTETWEKPVLREWDSIEKHSDGKYYYHKRSEEVVFDGTQNTQLSRSTETNTIEFLIVLPKMGIGPNNAKVISDKFLTSVSSYSEDIEGCYLHEQDIFIAINKSKLSTQNVSGFKTWLQTNNVTAVYQLATEEVYECINIDLITYENETNFIVHTGVIAPLSTLKVMCNINNVVRELQQKVSNLENYIQHVMIDALDNALNE